MEGRIGAAEFEEWREYFQLEVNEREPIHYYLAEILAEIRRSWVADKQKKEIKGKDFLLEFKNESEERAVKIDGHQMKRVFQLAFGGGKA